MLVHFPSSHAFELRNDVDLHAEFIANGETDEEPFRSIFERVNKWLNAYATRILSDQQVQQALDILKACEDLAENFGNFPLALILTYNNLSCAYRRAGQMSKARGYLGKAFNLLEEYPDSLSTGMSYINLCSIDAQEGK